jgi:hypothetical protein
VASLLLKSGFMKSLLIVVSLLLSAQIVWAQTPNSPEVMQKGPYRGQVIDGGERQNIKILSQQGNTVVISNLRHDHDFWNAGITMDRVTEVSLLMEHFTGEIPAGHTMLRFKFDTPVTLMSGQKTAMVNDIVFSVAAVPFKGESFDLINGLKNHFAISYRFLSLSEKAKVIIDGRKHKVDQYVLKLTPAERGAVLAEALRMSNTAPMAGPYNTLRRSCTTELFRVLDDALHYSLLERVGNAVTKIGSIYPNVVKIALMSRGLYEGKAPSLNAEWCSKTLQ